MARIIVTTEPQELTTQADTLYVVQNQSDRPVRLVNHNGVPDITDEELDYYIVNPRGLPDWIAAAQRPSGVQMWAWCENGRARVHYAEAPQA